MKTMVWMSAVVLTAMVWPVSAIAQDAGDGGAADAGGGAAVADGGAADAGGGAADAGASGAGDVGRAAADVRSAGGADEDEDEDAPESAAGAAKKHGCDAPNVFCVQRDGQALPGVTLEKTVAAGATIRVLVFDTDDTAAQIEFSGRPSPNSLTPGGGSNLKIDAMEGGAKSWSKVGDAAYVVPSDAYLVVGQIYRGTGDDKKLTGQLQLEVEQGLYFLSVGLMLPIVHGGSVTLVEETVAGTGDRMAVLRRDVRMIPALAVNFYPWGRRKGLLSPFERPGCRWVGDMLALQIGLGLDFSKFGDAIYIGGGLELVTGLTITGGAAVVKVDTLQAGHAPNEILGPTERATPASEHVVRGYFGISLSTEIVDTIRGVGDRVLSTPSD